MKDNFSTQSDKYAQYRPTYPSGLYDYIQSLVPTRINAWDCGTGNGQVAYQLSALFEQVYATDISQAQLDNAQRSHNIHYSLQAAEETTFPEAFFDLIVVAQAIHWFDFDKFYKEVKRILKPNGYLVVVGYNRLTITPEIDELITDFYTNIIGMYWDKERHYIDEAYKTIPFPLNEIEAPSLQNTFDWTFEHLIGYLGTWSAVKHYITAKGHNPIDLIQDKLQLLWGPTNTRPVYFPILLRVGTHL